MNNMFRGGMLAVLAMATLPVGGALTTPPGAIQVDGVAAYANAHVITYSDVLSTSRELQQMVALHRAGEEPNTLYFQVLNDLINRKLVLDAYEDQKEIKIPDEMVDERAGSVLREMFKGDRMAFLKALGEDGLSEALWRNQIREQMVVSAMRNLRVESQVRISPLAVRERYEQDPDHFAQPAKVKFSMIVIAKGSSEEEKSAQKTKLNAVREALTAGTSFADVARRYSEDAMAENGGVRDWIESDMLRKDLRDLVETSALDSISEVLDIGPNYSIITVQGRREAARTSFDDAYAQIERELRQEMSQQILEEWTARLRRDSFVRVLNESPF